MIIKCHLLATLNFTLLSLFIIIAKNIKKFISILQEFSFKLFVSIRCLRFFRVSSSTRNLGLALVDGFCVFAATVEFDDCIVGFAVLNNNF